MRLDPGEGEPAGVGNAIHGLIQELFPICRSITGNGVRETIRIIGREIPLQVTEVPTGTRAFDWTVPGEWNIREAWIRDEQGKSVVDFRDNNLHVMGYSVPVDRVVTLSELQEHLYSLEDQPDAIPYITSYYEERWGFCMAHRQRKALKEGNYHVFIDSHLGPGSLTYAECLIPGEREEEVFISTYICHPSLANNELSGPGVVTFLAKWILSRPRRLSYRIVFLPETIGSLTYLSRNLDRMKEKTIAGFNVSCVGDERMFSYVESRKGNTLADRVVSHVLSNRHPDFVRYSYLQRGSDERQYCSPGIDLPLVCVCRSKFGTYPEYHTSLDNLGLITPRGLEGSYRFLRECIEALEQNLMYRNLCLGEPQMGRRGLYPTLGTREKRGSVRDMMNLLAYADGSLDLIGIAEKLQVPVWNLYAVADQLKSAGLIREQEG